MLTILRVVLMVITAVATAFAARYALGGATAPDVVREVVERPERHARTPSGANPDSIGAFVAGHNPFRRDRRPSPIPFDPARAEGAPPIPPSPPRPALTVAGVVLGDVPAALVEGLPGVEGTRLMNVGDRVGEYSLREVHTESVVIAGRDTSWVLRVKGRTP